MRARILCLFALFFVGPASADIHATFTAEDLSAQEKLYPSHVRGQEALKIALQIFLHDDENAESPLLIAGSRAKLLNALNRHDAKLHLVTKRSEELKPQLGEHVQQNWIFCLYMPHVSDHLYWAVVDRRGVRDPYAYGFN